MAYGKVDTMLTESVALIVVTLNKGNMHKLWMS